MVQNCVAGRLGSWILNFPTFDATRCARQLQNSLQPREKFPASARKFPALQTRAPCFPDRSGGPRPPSAAVRGASAPRRRPSGATPGLFRRGRENCWRKSGCVLCLFSIRKTPNDRPTPFRGGRGPRAAPPAHLRPPAGGRQAAIGRRRLRRTRLAGAVIWSSTSCPRTRASMHRGCAAPLDPRFRRDDKSQPLENAQNGNGQAL